LKDERGFALILTLLITALLVALTAEFVDEVFVDSSARQNYTDGQQASLLANSGITGGIKLLQYGLNLQPYTAQTDLEHLAKLLHIEDKNGTIQVTAEEESGKLNINAIVDTKGANDLVYRPIAERLFKKLGLNLELLDAVADWIGTSEVARTAGAKTSYYQTLKPPYVAKSASLDTFEELRLVKGIDNKTLERLRPYITVYPDNPGAFAAGVRICPININTAAKELLASLDVSITDGMVQEIIDKRKTTPLKTNMDLGNNVSGMQTLALDLAKDYRIMLTEKGATFRLISQAQVNETVRIIEAVVRFGGAQPAILYWREY
jgi:general secretion pathway protein K